MYEMPDFEIIGFYGGKWPFRAKGIPPVKKKTQKAPLQLPVLPPLAERLPEMAGQKPQPPSSWHFDPWLFQRGGVFPSGNGVRKKRSE